MGSLKTLVCHKEIVGKIMVDQMQVQQSKKNFGRIRGSSNAQIKKCKGVIKCRDHCKHRDQNHRGDIKHRDNPTKDRRITNSAMNQSMQGFSFS